MRSTGGKSLTFIVGILIGILVALGIVFLLLIEFNPFQSITAINSSASRDTVISIERRGETTKRNKKAKSPKQTTVILPQSDTLTEAKESVRKPDTTNAEMGDEVIIVKRDEIIAKKTLEAIVKSEQQTNRSDSLIQQLENSPSKQSPIIVEFWISPVNFRGYKFVRSTLVVFGLDPNQESKIYRLQGSLYLKHNNVVYLCKNTEVFAPLRVIQDETITNQLR